MALTHKQGQYLAFIYYYTKLNQRPPSEADIQRYFKTTPPSVHNMIVQLEKKGLIEKKPNLPRSIKLLLPEEELPELNSN
jgi:Mn-dependent DtxR family transcriptional regulator